MEFGEPDRFTGPSPIFSPDGRHVLYAQERRLLVREADSQALVSLFLLIGEAVKIAWAPDSDHFLAVLRSAHASVQVFSVSDPSWGCTIAEGAAGCITALWSPDSSHILLVADFCIRLSLWSLETRECCHLPGPKHQDQGLAFSAQGNHLAVLQRVSCKDVLTIYSTSSWEPVASWMPETQDAADVSWSPDGNQLAVWELVTASYTLLIYPANGGEPVAKVDIVGGTGLGIKHLAWSPAGQLLVWSDWANCVHLSSVLTGYSPIAEFQHQDKVGASSQTGQALPVVYCEEELDNMLPGQENQPAMDVQGTRSGERRSRFVLQALPVSLACNKHQQPGSARGPPSSARLNRGVDALWWSADGSYLATRVAGKPHVLWIWSVTSLTLSSALVLQQPILDACWDPEQNRLLACSGQGKLYSWTPSGAACIHIPVSKLRPVQLCWNPDQPCLLLAGRDMVGCAYT